MTKIKDDVKVSVGTLLEAGIKLMAISKQLNLKHETVKKFAYNFKKKGNY
jgi:DNA-binding NarL/FixJ family response regulator